MMSISISVVTEIASVFANFPNKIAKITESFGDVDKGAICQH